MATTTRVLALQRISELMDDWWSAVTTSTGSTTTIVDTKLAQISGGDDDFCEKWYVRNVATGEIRLVTSYDEASVTITHVAMTTAVTNGGTYELHRIDPTLKHNALNRAVSLAYGRGTLYLPLRNETLVVDNLLSNWDFETYATGAFTGWTTGGSPTLSQESTRVWHGAYSAKIISAAAGGSDGTLSQNLFTSVNIHDVAGKSLKFKGRIWSATADVARLRVSFDGSTYTSSSYHAGSAEWEGPGTMYISVNIPTTATQMTCYCSVAAGTYTAYFDSVMAYISPVNKLTVPTAFVRGPHRIYQQSDQNESVNNFYQVGGNNPPQAGRILRLGGMGMLTQPSTDAGTYEIAEPQTELLYAYAMRWLSRAGVLQGAQQQRGRYQEDKKDWEAEITALEASPALRMPRMNAQMPDGWKIEEDSSGKYLIWDNR